ncbi:response regulator [Candidatus Campbellbacteria bacterium CG22_combo_CG10-13_8_21_14_all_36_13]|uniref:Response regulator n=1 Tax=Candidatus Campbellbacteria bacterium CG22_combo_CG10-13_8_21_14_all_36_13 TaxID=1974529 RepID=A0A2H0DXT5_9BACT|nr:MAG: response regulator [Candidatus Campbellbacteria bacterium CG22_combo_CG10-13_8_21_14_all_36_13]
MTGEKYKILIVDDDKFLLDIYTVKFREFGFDIDTAMSGQEALDKLKAGAKKFNVLLLDMVMPIMGGLELLAEVKKQKLDDGLVIIVLTNQGQPEDIKKAQEYDVDGYIVKATSIPSEVLAEVKQIVDKKLG